MEQPKWIIDGNCMRSLEMRFSRADTAIYFCYPRAIAFWRLFKRCFQKEWAIADMAKGCKKSLRFKLLKYTFCFQKRYGAKIETLKEKYPHVHFVTIKSDKEALKLID